MKDLTAQEISDNWNEFISNIDKYILGNRKNQLLDYYNSNQESFILMPASTNKKYHSCFKGGYIYHVNKVVKTCLYLHKLWNMMGDKQNYTLEELIFSAINHDLGKKGDKFNEAYLESTDEWRKDKLGELYNFNTKLSFMTVPDRSLFILQQNEIGVSENEWVGIKTHDGLYDLANEAYLKPYSAESRPRTTLPYILHQADQLASVIEFQQQYQTDNKLIK